MLLQKILFIALISGNIKNIKNKWSIIYGIVCCSVLGMGKHVSKRLLSDSKIYGGKLKKDVDYIVSYLTKY